MSFGATFDGAELYWTHALIFVLALASFKAIDLVLVLSFSAAENKLVVASFLNAVAFVWVIGIYFQKRRRKPPGQLSNRPNPTYPVIIQSLLLFCGDIKRGREAGCIIQCLVAVAVQSAAPAAQTLKTYFQVGIQVPLKARLQRHLLSGCGVTALNTAASSSNLLNIISLRF